MKYLKYLSFLVILSWTMAWAGMIEIVDDDPLQIMDFSTCSVDSFDHVIVGILIFPDSGGVYVETPHALTEEIHSDTLGYIAPDRDVNGDFISGRYDGEYWIYVKSVLPNGYSVLPEDTTHVVVGYNITSCGSFIRVD